MMPENKTACYVTTIKLSLATKLQKELQEKGFELFTPPYTLFSAKKKGLSCTVYQSGKLVVQGKDMQEFIEFYLEPEILQEFKFSHPNIEQDFTPHIGGDESGKGDYFGPLCVAGVYADHDGIKKLLDLGVKDSKQITDKNIKTLAAKIRKDFLHEILVLFPTKYNELYASFQNLNFLLAWGHSKIIDDLTSKAKCNKVLIDQFSAGPTMAIALRKRGLNLNFNQVPRAESDAIVAAASILARNAFVEGLEQLEEKYQVPLPKGASSIVKQAALKIVQAKGPEILSSIAKLHFKTTQEILSL